MNDAAVRELARRAGIAVRWTDYADKRRRVPLDTMRRILTALGLPCDTEDDLSHSRRLLDGAQTPPLITTTAGQAVDLPIRAAGDPPRARLIDEHGVVAEVAGRQTAGGVSLPSIQEIGYHTVEIGQTRLKLAVAPPRCVTIEDIAPGERVVGLAAQIYGLRSAGDCGIGDMAGVVALAKSAAALDVDALALSPAHALFAADPGHFSPYSPSSRLFYNPLLADAALLFGPDRMAKARTATGVGVRARELEASSLINWTSSSHAKMAVLRALFEDFAAADLAGNPATKLAVDFAKFRGAQGAALEDHALFETLHEARLRANPQAWNWRDWPPEWRDPHSATVRSFAEKNQHETLFYSFLQWVADRSFAVAQQGTRHAGMRIGVIADLAVGTHSGGSHAWTNQDDILGGLEIGAPPDLFSASGQNWGLTTFSPRALIRSGFAPFIATIRACMRQAGGVRIDHVMSLMRLWVTPRGTRANEGAYLTYPLDDLLRLTALESHRHRAIVIGEDLGTVPAGFRDRLTRTGIYKMNVLWFEREGNGFALPQTWPAGAAAMTSTHDLPTVVGWWRGSDLETRVKCGSLADAQSERAIRGLDRDALWRAFKSAKAAEGNLPPADQPARVADAAVKFIAETPSRLALLPLEDALALEEQPNLPGTIDEHPNWRRRYQREAGTMLDAPDVRRRVETLTRRGAR
jgi:4-alpha-glucanotransferase